MKSSRITKILAREILDSRGFPTIETTVWAGEISAKAAVPSGASTGIHEALELRDGDKKRYLGKGVLKAVKKVNDKIAKLIKGQKAINQGKIDQLVLELDGSVNKSKLGANAILSVSLAVARLAAKAQKMELFQYLAGVYGYEVKSLPTPLFNVINGGKHADSGLDIQEFFIIPQKGKFSERLRQSAEVYQVLKQNLLRQNLSIGIGDEGGFAPHLASNEQAFRELILAAEKAGYKMDKDFRLGIDAAASEFFESKTNLYQLKASKIKLRPASAWQFYKKWVDRYHLEIIEDGCGEDDFLGWKFLTQKLGEKTLIMGDDLFVTNIKRLSLGIQQKIANAIIIKPNQIGTLSETIETVKLAQKHNYKIAIAHRSGETNDPFIADLAVAVNAQYIKAGAPCRGERLAKYNRLLEIERMIDKNDKI